VSAAVSMPMTRERPVIFSSPMIAAIRDGRKTVTRRLVKLPPAPNHLGRWEATTVGGEGVTDSRGKAVEEHAAVWHTRTAQVLGCPYGRPRDQLHVREAIWHRRIATGSHTHVWGENPAYDVLYVADHPYKPVRDCTPDEEFVKRSPIFMPRWTSRLTLEIVDVRAERLHEITDEDIEAEGFEVSADGVSVYPLDAGRADGIYADARTAFSTGWDRLNGKRCAWATNPLVWRIEFSCIRGGRS
jgi:hypothetical protein